jgi:hypothetical protein
MFGRKFQQKVLVGIAAGANKKRGGFPPPRPNFF